MPKVSHCDIDHKNTTSPSNIKDDMELMPNVRIVGLKKGDWIEGDKDLPNPKSHLMLIMCSIYRAILLV
jgi:hypothetical protein